MDTIKCGNIKMMATIKQVITDVDGNLSSRRVAMFICLAMLFIEEMSNLFGRTIDSGIISAISTITVAVVAGVAADRFGKC